MSNLIIGTTTPFHLIHLAKGLERLGNQVDYHTYHPSYRVKNSGLKSTCFTSHFWREFPNSFLAVQRFLPLLQKERNLLMLENMDNSIAQDMKNGFDLYIGLSGMAVNSAVTAKELGAKVIIDRGAKHVIEQNKILEACSRPLNHKYIERELRSYEVADYIAIPSTHVKESFLHNGIPESKLFVNPYGVDIKRFNFVERELNNKITNIVFIGSWSMQKGVDVLIDAILDIPNVLLTHIGTIGDVPFPSSDKFVSLGHINNSDLSLHLKDKDALILPSRQDGFGMVLLEALVSGIPIIASKETGGPDIQDITSGVGVDILEELSVCSVKDAICKIKQQEQVLLDETQRELLSWDSYSARYNRFISESVLG